MAMNARAKQLWIEALRSGEYPQDSGALRTQDGYCCLGVLCEVALKEGVIKPEDVKPNKADDDELWSYGPGIADDITLPEAVQNWAEIDEAGTRSDCVVTDVEGSNLALLNDRGESFEDIAKVIEAEF